MCAMIVVALMSGQQLAGTAEIQVLENRQADAAQEVVEGCRGGDRKEKV